ncbi:MAG TPA: lytic transglycosylase domain-containing protein, partial [Longimicrobiales bacterium]
VAPDRPAGWGLAFDAAVPERRGGPEEGSDDVARRSGSSGSGAGAPDWSGEERRAWSGEERRGSDRRGGGDRRNGERRGGQDRRTGKERRGLMTQVRELGTRFKEPLIGLGVAAAAMPLMHAGSSSPEKTEATNATAEHAAAPAQVAATAANTNRDLDAELGARWSNTERSSVIQAAVDKYDITPQLASQIYDHAKGAGVDPRMAYGLVKTESDFKHTAVSHVGARGLTQLMPGTARWLEPGTSASDLFNPEVSLKVGFKYLRQLIDRYKGDVQTALTAYNRGPGIVDHAVNRGHDPDNGYAGTVLGNALHNKDVQTTDSQGGATQQPG